MKKLPKCRRCKIKPRSLKSMCSDCSGKLMKQLKGSLIEVKNE